MRYLILLVSTLVLCAVLTAENVTARESTAKPNILFISVDDANYIPDAEKNSDLEFMPRTLRLIADEGVTFENATFAQPVCCPNRATWLTGQYPHNTGVWTNKAPNGGFETFYERGLQKDTYATRAKEAGYRTAYLGKLMNGYGGRGGTPPNYVMPGFDRWFASTSSGRAVFVNEKKERRDWQDGTHDKVVGDKTEAYIERHVGKKKPLLMAINFHGPHVPEKGPESFQKLFTSEKLPKTPGYNEEDVSDKPAHIKRLPQVDEKWERKMLKLYRDRLRATEYIDRRVKRIIDLLSKRGQLKNTYIIFTSDNGYLLGEHRSEGKGRPYVESSRFPILMRGPGIPAGTVRSEMVSSVDIRTTIERMASTTSTQNRDGQSFLGLAQGKEQRWRTYAYSEQKKEGRVKPAWMMTHTPNETYTLYPTRGEDEFYDLSADPYQLENDSSDSRATAHRAAVKEFRQCAGASCRRAGKRISE